MPRANPGRRGKVVAPPAVFRPDNYGIGIPESAQGRIFNVFERLHSAEEYPGTGIGLPIVKKGLECMGGRAVVEFKPDAGAVFCIDMPAPLD